MAKEKAPEINKDMRPCPSKPHLMMKDFEFPPGSRARFVTMRELDGDDEMEAGMWAERRKTPSMKNDPLYVFQAERKEAMRLSIVAVDGVAVTHPYFACDKWTVRMQRCVQAGFNKLNGVEDEELKKFLGESDPNVMTVRVLPLDDGQSVA